MLRQIVYPQTRYLPALIVAIALLAIFVGGFALQYIETQLVAAAGESLTLAAVDIADKLDLLMAERYGDIQMMAHSQTFQGRDRVAMSRYLSWMISAYPLYDWLGVLDADGRIVAATDPTSVGRDRSARIQTESDANLKQLGVPSAQLFRAATPGFVEEQHARRQVPVVTGYARTKGVGPARSLRWGVLVRVDRSDILLPIQSVLWKLSAAGLAAGVPLLGVLIWTTRRLQREHGQMQEMMNILDASRDGLFIFDVESLRFLYVNQGAQLQTGYSQEELLIMTPVEIKPAFDEPGFRDLLAQVRVGASSTHMFTTVHRRKDGVDVPVEIILQYRARQGQSGCCIAVVRDITERLRGEQALHESEGRTRHILETALDAFIGMDAGGFITDWNAQAERLFGWSRQEAIGRLLAVTIIPAQHREAHEHGLRRFLATGEGPVLNTLMEITACHRDGHEFPVELTISATRASGGDYTFSAFLRDISMRKREETALRISEERYSLLARAANDVLWDWDLPTNRVWWSDGLQQIFGYNHKEVEPGVESWSTRIHPDDFSSVMAGVDDVMKGGGETWSGEYRFRRVDGSYVYTFNRALLVRNEQGTVVRMAGSMVDLTARKQAEEALRQAKSEAEAASQAKSGFLATMSHEIRTPMNGVIGMTRLLLDTDLTAEQREFAETVRSSGEHLLTLISDILDFSKIEAGKMTLETIDFDLRNAVAEAVDLLAGQASAKGLNLACLFHADVPSSLRGDPGRLRQVLLNLLSNAIKFTNQGDVTLSVTLRQQTEDAATVRFEVQDSGIGLSPEAQGRLFQSFSQADSSTTRKFGGTGLGLAICKQLTELMGGDIGVESQP
ncbi:MAG: PAS domain S-box protein, partial [Nitrospirae bacterium]|nr:PAS domain S-box protein [Nitrospirota bacterium]